MPEVGGLARQRVLSTLDVSHGHAMTLLVAPAGSGKTTALVEYTRAANRRHAWFRAESAESEAPTCLAHLHEALSAVVDGLAAEWTDADAAIAALAATPDPAPTLLVIDDLHELFGSSAEAALAKLVRRLPTWLSILAASRRQPAVNLSDLRVSDRLAEVPDDVLRWRTWEVEWLFRDFYRLPLRPEEAAQLTLRTGGWAAGLQLFHLASQHLPAAKRTQLIDDLHTRPGLVRDYLTLNVLAGLPDELRDFMIDTSVLGRLDDALCNRLCGRDDSRSLLQEMNARRLFLLPWEDGHGYRYHEVLRAYLEVSLLERDGTVAARARYHRAGQVLEAAGAVAEALHAFARAEAWHDAARLLGSDGPSLAAGGGRRVLGELPEALVQSDPWLQVAQARALVGEGRLQQAAATYQESARALGNLPAAAICRDELAAIRPWIDHREHPVRRPTDLVRRAVRAHPRQAAEALADGTATGLLASAVSLLLAGDVRHSRQRASEASSAPDGEVFTLAGARVVEHLADTAAGQPGDTADLLWAAETLEQLGFTWFARLARTIASSDSSIGLEEAATSWELVDPREDPWGHAVMALVIGTASVIHHEPRTDWLERATTDFRRLGAATLEAWARAWRAVAAAQLDLPEAVRAAEEARSLARAALVPGAQAVAELAISCTTDPRAGEARARATDLARELGLALPDVSRKPVDEVLDLSTPSRIQCFGGLDLTVDGRRIDLQGLKPQARSLLAMLGMHAGSPVHREQLIDALWPGEDPAAGLQRLPVLISTVRRHLEPDVVAGAWTLLLRSGQAYVLQVPADTHVDVHVFDDAIAAASRAHGRRDDDIEASLLRVAIDEYRGDLLPEFGPADWIVHEREHRCLQFAHAAQVLAEQQLRAGDAAGCVELARAGLRVDRYHSQLWRLLASAHRACGDVAAAAHAEAEHAAVLEELGVPG